MRWLVAVMLCACGRLAFDPLASGDGGAGTDGAGTDVMLTPGAWTSVLTTPSNGATVKRVAFGPSGEVAATGEVAGDLTIDGFAHTAIGPLDLFVVRFEQDGTRSWSHVYGGTGAVDGRDVAINRDGFVFVHGLATGVAMYGTTQHDAATGQDPITLAHQPEGPLLTASWFPSTGANAQGRGMGIGPSVQAVYSGTYEGSIDIGSTVLPDETGMAAYVTHTGVSEWTASFSSTTRVAANDVDLGSANPGACSAGDFTGATDFAGTMLTPYGGADAFVVNHGAGGAVQSAIRIGGASTDAALGVVETANGDCVVVGYLMSASADFGTGPVATFGGLDGFVARYGPNGALRWAHVIGGLGEDGVHAVDEGADGTIWIAGEFSGTGNFAGTTATADGVRDAFVLRFGPAGARMDLRTLGGPGLQAAYGLAVDTTLGIVTIGGEFLTSLDLGTGVITATGGAFVHRYSY